MQKLDSVRFHEYQTTWDKEPAAIRRQVGSFENYYRRMSERTMQHMDAGGFSESWQGAFALLNVFAEYTWLQGNRPYYKLWPAYACMLSKTSLEIPTELFRVPHASFVIRMPKDPCLFGLHSILVFERTSPQRQIGVFWNAQDTLDHPFKVGGLAFSLEDNTTLEECWKKISSEDKGKEQTPIVLRIALATTMLAVSTHRAIEHDVLARLRERYDSATSDAVRKELAETSIKYGLKGWNIGRGRNLQLTTDHSEKQTGGGKELQYQHVRGGHFHTVAHGPNHSLRKVVFFENIIVRPDLPVPPIEKIA